MERLKEIRNARGITQEALAKHLSVGKNTISRYENGDRAPDLETLNKIANFFDVTIDYLLGRIDDSSSPRSSLGEYGVAFRERLAEFLSSVSSADAESAYLDREKLAMFIDGLLTPTFGDVCDAADSLGCSIDYLLGRSDQPNYFVPEAGEPFFTSADDPSTEIPEGVQFAFLSDTDREIMNETTGLDEAAKRDVLNLLRHIRRNKD